MRGARELWGRPPPAARHRGGAGARLSRLPRSAPAAVRDGAAARGRRCAPPSSPRIVCIGGEHRRSVADRDARPAAHHGASGWPTSASTPRSASPPRSCRRSEPAPRRCSVSLFVVVAVARWLIGRWGVATRLIYRRSRPVPPAGAVLAGAREVTLHTADGIELGAWYVPPAGANRGMAVLVAADNAATGRKGRRSPRRWPVGSRRAVFDYRGYGGNRGGPNAVRARARQSAPRCDSYATRSGSRWTGCCTSARASVRPW